MTVSSASVSAQLSLLGWLDTKRLAGRLRRPAVATLTVGLPLLVILGALWSLGATAQPALTGRSAAVTLAMLVSGTVSFLSYGILFGASDWRFLRLAGVDARAVIVERAVRLTGAGVAVAAALALPYGIAGQPWGRPLVIGLVSAVVAAGIAVTAFAHAANMIAGGGDSALGVGIRQWDPELARTAPLVYAPLVPFLLGTLHGGLAVGVEGHVLGVVAGLAVGGGGIYSGSSVFAKAAPRFLPRAGEIAYTPPPGGTEGGLRIGRGVAILLPRRAAAVWARDAAVGGRRFPWALRLSWPVAMASVLALARWGSDEATRIWVVIAVGLALLAQGGAVVGMGLFERHGRRWLDRAAGIVWWERFVGRTAWAFGLSTWLLIPVTLAWSWWSGVPGAWAWPVAGVVLAATAAAAALMVSGR
jgi:hypothetical protein